MILKRLETGEMKNWKQGSHKGNTKEEYIPEILKRKYWYNTVVLRNNYRQFMEFWFKFIKIRQERKLGEDRESIQSSFVMLILGAKRKFIKC